MRGYRIPFFAALTVSLAPHTYSPAVAASEWDWLITPYLWASDTSARMTVGGEVIEGGVDFDDLIDKVDMGSQLHFEGSRDRFGFFFDITYLSVKEKEEREAVFPVDGQLQLQTSLETLIGEVAGTYRLTGDSKFNGFELMLGARVIDTEFELDIDFAGPAGKKQSVSASETLTDVFVGGRYIYAFSPNWVMALRGDIATGDSDRTLNAQAEVVYLFGKNNRFGAVLGYRYMSSEYESSARGEKIDAELTMSGPALGFAFRF